MSTEKAQNTNPLLTHQQFNFREVLISVLAGGIAGASIDFALFPIDSIKTRLQASTRAVDYQKQASHISKFKGLLSPMLASFPCSATFMLSYEYTKYWLRNRPDSGGPLGQLSFTSQNMLAASVGECTQALIRSPSEVIKQNMQLGTHGSMSESIRNVWRLQGLGGFYAGYFSLILREVPFSAIQFSLYEQIKLHQIEQEAKRSGRPVGEVKLSPLQLALNGIVVGSFSGFIVTPFDVLKTKQMTHDLQMKKLGMGTALKEVWADAGVRGLYRGGAIRAFYIGVGGFAFFGMYENLKSYLT